MAGPASLAWVRTPESVDNVNGDITFLGDCKMNIKRDLLS